MSTLGTLNMVTTILLFYWRVTAWAGLAICMVGVLIFCEDIPWS